MTHTRTRGSAGLRAPLAGLLTALAAVLLVTLPTATAHAETGTITNLPVDASRAGDPPPAPTPQLRSANKCSVYEHNDALTADNSWCFTMNGSGNWVNWITIKANQSTSSGGSTGGLAQHIYIRWHLQYPDGSNSADLTGRVDQTGGYNYKQTVNQFLVSGTYTAWAQFQANDSTWSDWQSISVDVHN